jgi:hypothetical protein
VKPGDKVKSLVNQPTWIPKPLAIGDLGVVTGAVGDKYAVAFDGVCGQLSKGEFQKI